LKYLELRHNIFGHVAIARGSARRNRVMMTLEEIERSNVNKEVAREAYEQATKRLVDTLETKKSYEQKAFTLFNAYLTITLALFGVGGALYKDDGFAFPLSRSGSAAGYSLLERYSSCWHSWMTDTERSPAIRTCG
jgi:hypothetical protein